MIELATGALDPKRERELLAHAGECDVCREAYRHAKEVFAALDRSVEALVAGEPSPHFAARLRARIADDRVTISKTWSHRAFVVAGALASIVLGFILVSHSPLHTDSNPSVATSTPVPVAEGSRSAPAPSPPQTPQYPLPNRASRAARTRPLFPEVLVPGGQLAAALQLSDAVNDGSVDSEQLLARQIEITKPIDVSPIEIAPLESSDADPTGDGSTLF
jgi:hypothetical protein